VGPLVEKLGQEATRRAALERERTTPDAADGAAAFATATARRALLRQATRIRAALLEHRGEARDVLRAFVDRIDFTPFGAGRARGFTFEGIGDYGALVGTTNAHTAWCPRGDLPPLGCSYPSVSGYEQHDVGTSVDASTQSDQVRSATTRPSSPRPVLGL
jgi:hypothetical protein